MRLLPLTQLAVWGTATHAGTDLSVDAETGLASWQTETNGIQVRLTQISPDQARAFYQARGFSSEAAERYAHKCVFMTVVRNIGDTPIRHRLADWRYVYAGRQPPRAIRSKADWERLWRSLPAPSAGASSITPRWSRRSADCLRSSQTLTQTWPASTFTG